MQSLREDLAQERRGGPIPKCGIFRQIGCHVISHVLVEDRSRLRARQQHLVDIRIDNWGIRLDVDRGCAQSAMMECCGTKLFTKDQKLGARACFFLVKIPVILNFSSPRNTAWKGHSRLRLHSLRPSRAARRPAASGRGAHVQIPANPLQIGNNLPFIGLLPPFDRNRL